MSIDRVHVLRRACDGHVFHSANDAYLEGFLDAVDRVYGAAKWERVAREKFGVSSPRFDDEAYLAHAAELSVQNHIAQADSVENVEPEKKVNPPKDVDCYFETLGVKVALDVKCAHRPKVRPESFTLWTDGRLPRSSMETAETFMESLSKAPGGKQVVLGQKKDNSLREFLTGAHKKFHPEPSAAHFNGVVVGCGQPFDVMVWHQFLHSWRGLFTRTSFHNPNEYSLVDAVVLSNLKDVHARRLGRSCWTLDDTFILPVLNPASRRASLNADVALSPFKHHLTAFRRYLDAVARGRDGHILESVGVLHYIEDVLPLSERERYFGPRRPEVAQHG